jgi:hypothetical protein
VDIHIDLSFARQIYRCRLGAEEIYQRDKFWVGKGRVIEKGRE